jgi:hypothetical protein
MKRVYFPKLTVPECKELFRAHQHLDAALRTLHRASWGGAPAIIELLADTDRFICELYNRAEPAFLHHVSKSERESAAPSYQADPPATEPPAEFGPATESAEGE